MKQTLLLTCEHASARVPAAYAPLFSSARARRALAGHRGWDPGALSVARMLQRDTGAPLIVGKVSRLLVELNRSAGSRRVFSEFTRELDAETRQALMQRYYHPHRDAVTAEVATAVARGQRVLHVGVHSFTPVLDGERRRADVGLLYDPARRRERAFCGRFVAALGVLAPGLRVRRNYPYRGTDDGLTRDLRRAWPPARYLGIELELNQVLLRPGRPAFPGLYAALRGALRAARSGD